MIARLMLALAASCVPVQAQPRSLYDGDQVFFERAHFLKPREHTDYRRAHQLAPLIIQEMATGKASLTRGSGVDQPPSRPAKSGITNDSTPQPQRVFFTPGSIDRNGHRYEQMTYWWSYAPPQPPERRTPARRGPDVRPLKRAGPALGAPWVALRLTMNTNGVPVIYEVMESRSGIRQIFVTQSIEAAARAALGPALPGRRHAVEPALNEAPQVVVPRVLDDPPDVMGPFLYLRHDTHAVATVICRCMNAQFRQLVGQGLYELVPAVRSGNTSDATRLDAANPRGLPEDFFNQTDGLSRSLRLPPGF